MNARILVVLACIANAFLGGLSLSRAGDRSTVLLDNGHILHGEVVREGDGVLIKLGPGSQLRLPRGRIKALGRSLDDVYLQQLDRIYPNDVDKTLELARWCLRHQLDGRAGELMVKLNARAPDDPRVRSLEQLMRHSLKATRSTSPGDNAHGEPSELSAPFTAAPIGRQATAQFTQQIQPLLANRCGASSCHGRPNGSKLVLNRSLGGRWTQRMTQRNLHAVLSQVNRADVAKSRLLLSATTAHGGMSEPVFVSPRDDRSIEILRNWLDSLATTSTPEQPADLPEANTVAAEEEADDAPMQTNGQTAPAVAQSHPFDKPKTFEPRDPFDPDIFNRRFFPERFEGDEP